MLQVSADGRLTMPQAGLDLVAVGLTSDEAEGCAALLAHTDTAADTAVPAEPDPTEAWRAYTDTAGALRAEHTQPRQDPDPDDEDAEPASSLLAEQDETYLDVAATTTADLQALAPRVSDTRPPARRGRRPHPRRRRGDVVPRRLGPAQAAPARPGPRQHPR